MNKLEKVVKKLQSNHIEVNISSTGKDHIKFVYIHKLNLLNFIITKCKDSYISIPLQKVYETILKSYNTDDNFNNYYLFIWNSSTQPTVNINILINQAFTWDRTEEGHIFWSHFYESLHDYCDLIELILNLNKKVYPDE